MVQRTSDRPITTFGRPQWVYDDENTRAPLSTIPPPGKRTRSNPIYTPSLYGNMLYRPCVYAAPGDNLALASPSIAQRVYLLVVNIYAGSIITLNFDNPASPDNGIPIPPGGHWLFDNVIPQNDIHIFSPIIGYVPIVYLDIDVTNTNYIHETLTGK